MSTGGAIDPKVIEKIPAETLRTLPGGAPPPGVQPDFSNPPTLVPALLGASIAFLVLAILCFSIRIYTKAAITKNWRWDDLTCSLGFACSIVYFEAIVDGSLNGRTGRHVWDLHLDKILSNSSLRQDYITTILGTPALGLIKCSLFIQYYTIFRPWRWFRISVWIGAIVSVVFYVAVTITGFVLNSPWPGESLLEDIFSWHYLKFADFSIPTGVIGMLVDWYLLVLPIRAVLLLQMSSAKKFGVLIVFMTGGIAAIASTLSLYYRVRLQRYLTDAPWHVTYVLLWGMIELFAGVAVSSMPTVSQFLTRENSMIAAWSNSFRNSLTHLLTKSSGREKISDDNFSLRNLNGSTQQAPENKQVNEMSDLEAGYGKATSAKMPRMETSQINPGHDVFNTQEQHEGAPIEPLASPPATDRQRLEY